jgi:hypothetical protein
MGDAPYIEGAWMTKYNGKYYLQYAAPGTQYNVYADGVYVSDEPLQNFKLARNNPYSYKPGGFMNGAGHGSTILDKQGAYWHMSTMSISKNDDMERRVGLWKAGFDADGELYCDQRYGDWPVALSAPAFSKPEYMLLSYGKAVTVSSGTGAEYVTDENARTWCKAGSVKPGEWVEVDLGKDFDVHAIQINFADEGLKFDIPEGGVVTYDERFIDINTQRTRWKLESMADNGGYTVLVDKSNADSDLSHDFLLFNEGVSIRKLRLTLIELPYSQTPCISGIRVFGYGQGQPPKATENVSAKKTDDLNMDVAWEAPEATGANIHWGFAPDKLYHSYMVFGKNSQRIGALIKDEPVFIRVDTFNESGITEGMTQEVC